MSILGTGWTGFLARRLVGLMVILCGLVFATFMMVHLIPGDPAFAIAEMHATPEELQKIRHELGTDQPIGQQFINYCTNLAHGNLGASFVTSEPVTQIISERIGSSLQLASVSVAL